MSLLLLDRVTKRVSRGRIETLALDEVTLRVEAGELMVVQGCRGSGRSTLLRIAAGMVRPDAGRVMLAGLDLTDRRILGREIGWVHDGFLPGHGRTVAEQIAFPLLGTVGRHEAHRRALARLEALGVADLAALRPADCQPHELRLAGIARASMAGPRLLLLDEPITAVSPMVQRRMMELLRAFTLDGVAVLMTSDGVVRGADRMVAIDAGRLGGVSDPPAAQVIQLPRSAS